MKMKKKKKKNLIKFSKIKYKLFLKKEIEMKPNKKKYKENCKSRNLKIKGRKIKSNLKNNYYMNNKRYKKYQEKMQLIILMD